MQAQDVIEIINQLERARVMAWLDGGWGVDALVGKQTRLHDDIDLVISFDQICLAQEALGSSGYAVVGDELPTRFVMCDDQGRSIDFHPVMFDQQGDGVQQLPDGTEFHYPHESFVGIGYVGNRPVRCITAETQVLCHLGYEPDDKDVHDMKQLQEHFQLDLPASYRKYFI